MFASMKTALERGTSASVIRVLFQHPAEGFSRDLVRSLCFCDHRSTSWCGGQGPLHRLCDDVVQAPALLPGGFFGPPVELLVQCRSNFALHGRLLALG